ncbi:MAG: type II toxin-antitoxin system HicA family toxin [Candidatus Berkelbacteria bacterium]|nr:type II toxin-antitoxin system HicA family toxin [Candidatus Berkelbacteria bacterium]
MAILSAEGCKLVKQGKGSHEIWSSPLSRINFTFPKKVISRHTANKILKDAGLSRKL